MVQRKGHCKLSLFSVSVPCDAVVAIDAARKNVNAAKHEEEHFATEADYRSLMNAV
jgi:hypothetical protein